MNASVRWAFHFAAELECVRCRAKRPLTIYHFDGSRLTSSDYTVEELHSLVPTIDVWCQNCEPRATPRVRSQGRQNTKQEAARIATLRAGSQLASRYDTYLSSGGVHVTKRQLIDAVVSMGCQVCGGDDAAIYPSVGGILWSSATLSQLETALSERWLLCPEHKKRIDAGADYPPNCIVLDENFWARFDG